jgi:hypothetical protein
MGICVSWRVVSASAAGTSHSVKGAPCEDSCWAGVDSTASGTPLLSIFVSDGAGSAAKGGEGADLAVQVAAEFIGEKLKLDEFGLNDELAVECIAAIRTRLYARAELSGLNPRDYACTFLGVLSSPLGTVVMQIGDGGVVLDVGSGLHLAVVPMSGEYANMTHFVTDEDAIKLLVTKSYPDPVLRVAAFTDGLQRLILDMATNRPYEPFFTRFFGTLLAAAADQYDELEAALKKFLNSSSVNDRTDDDKTLAIAVLMK